MNKLRCTDYGVKLSKISYEEVLKDKFLKVSKNN